MVPGRRTIKKEKPTGLNEQPSGEATLRARKKGKELFGSKRGEGAMPANGGGGPGRNE